MPPQEPVRKPVNLMTADELKDYERQLKGKSDDKSKETLKKVQQRIQKTAPDEGE